jgi:hypothetical protein
MQEQEKINNGLKAQLQKVSAESASACEAKAQLQVRGEACAGSSPSAKRNHNCFVPRMQVTLSATEAGYKDTSQRLEASTEALEALRAKHDALSLSHEELVQRNAKLCEVNTSTGSMHPHNLPPPTPQGSPFPHFWPQMEHMANNLQAWKDDASTKLQSLDTQRGEEESEEGKREEPLA